MVVSFVVQGKNGDTDWYYSKQISGAETVDKATIAAAVDDTVVTSDNIDLSQCKIWLETTADDGMAYVVRLTRTITTSLIGNYASHGSIDEGRTVAQGDDTTINYQADPGYNVSKIEIDGVRITDVSAYQNSYTFKNVGQSHEIAIIFGITRYSIKYNLDGGTNAGINLNGYTVETPSFRFADASKTDYTFIGWFDADENKVDGIVNGSRTGDLELTARWKATDYKITYNLGDGAKNASANPSSYTVENETITLADPTRSGYDFLGWTGSNGDTPQKNVTIAAGSSGEKTYTANWQAIDYDITYNLDGGTNAASNPKKYNVETADIVFAAPEKDGHTFGGWFDADNKQVTGIAKGSRTGNLELTAKWNANKCTVKFVDWDGTELKTEEIEYGKAATAPANPTRIGYTFTGWSADFSKILDNTTITAQYEINKYKVTFDANGGSFDGTETKEAQVEYAQTVAAPEPAPTRAGYDFVKWTTDEAGQNDFNFDTLIDSDETLYAQWKIIDYTITYNVGDGATNAASNPQTYNVEANDIVFAAPTKTGYVFSGWFDVNNKRVTGIAKGSRTGNLELTAQWEKEPVVVANFVIGSFEYHVQKDGKSVYIKARSKKIKKLAVPKTVKDSDGNVYKVVGIEKAGFKNCKKLTKVSGGKNITAINANAFAGCKKLKNFKCTSKSLKKIGKNAFAKTSKLTKITINKTTKLKTVKGAFKKAGKNSGKGLTVKVKSSKRKAYKKLILKKGGNKKLKVQ